MFDPGSVRVRGPMRAHVVGLWAHLMRQGYAPLSSRNLLGVAADLGRWLEAEDLGLVDLREDVVAAFLRHRRRTYTQFLTGRALAPLLAHLRAAGAIPKAVPTVDVSPVSRLIREYATYLEHERGLVANTIRAYTTFATRYVRDERPRLDWGRLTAMEVTQFVLRSAGESSSTGTCKLVVTQLRSLLRFLQVRGVISRDLAACVPAVAGWRLAGLPKALEVSQIDRLVSSFDRTPIGLRDSAIVRLMLRLGLRAREVAALALDDVDWQLGEISVHGKGRHQSRLPLPEDVGRELAAYLRRGRPRSALRSLFLRSRAPYAGMRAGAIIAAAGCALRRAGVPSGGAHLLRHTAATQLLRRGASLPEIAHVLRHRHIDTTAIYAKVDLASLGALARPWPGGVP